MSDERQLRRRIAAALLVAGWVVYVAVAWRSMGALRRLHGGMEFRDYFTPGLVDTVEVIRSRGVPRAFGPHHDVSPFVFHRFNEMLYPLPYYTPYVAEQLGVGDVYILLSGQEPPVDSKVLSESRYFRVMEVLP